MDISISGQKQFDSKFIYLSFLGISLFCPLKGPVNISKQVPCGVLAGATRTCGHMTTFATI